MSELFLSTQIEEDDYEPIFIFDWECFKVVPEIAALFPGGLDPASREANVNGLKFGVFGGPIERACAKITINDKIISFISCQVYRGPKGILSTDPDPPLTLPGISNPEDRAFFEWYWSTYFDKVRANKEFQVPMVFVQVICTDPAWQRHGAAAMLMSWCMGFAKKEGIQRCILGASPFAAQIGIYEKYGFHRAGVIEVVDQEKFPGRIGTPQVVMVKDL